MTEWCDFSKQLVGWVGERFEIIITKGKSVESYGLNLGDLLEQAEEYSLGFPTELGNCDAPVTL